MEELTEKFKLQSEALKGRMEEAETRKMRNALSTELGIQSATSGRSLEDLGDAVSDPRTVLAYSETKREMAKTEAKAEKKAGGALYRSFAGSMRAEIADIAVDVNDPEQVKSAVKEIFDNRRKEASRLTEEQIKSEAGKEWDSIYKLAGPAGLSEPSDVIGSDPEISGAIRDDGTVDWMKLRTLLRQKWEKAKKGTVTAPIDTGPDGAADWAAKEIEKLGLLKLEVLE